MDEDKFSGRASVYAKYRPTYPQALLDYLYLEVGFNSASLIADIGAGTGIFSKLLVAKGSNVICIEPNHDMLKVAQRELADFPQSRFIQAPAENTGLASNSVDFITAAQSFHWFDRQLFQRECQRILKPHGKVVLIWNTKDSHDQLTIENAQLNKRLCPNFKGFSGGIDKTPQAYKDFFKNGHCDYKTFQHDLFSDEQTFIGRNLSSSYAPMAGSVTYNDYVQAIKQLFAKYNTNNIIKIANITRCYIGEV